VAKEGPVTDASWRLTPTSRSVPQARRAVGAVLDDWGLVELRDSALLLVSEVVTNAVLHARTDITLEMARDGNGVRISVSDGSPVPPALRRHSETSTTGRGLHLLDLIADSWSAESSTSGKTVVFTLTGGHDPWASAEALVGEADQ
jgi:anti-sigma regulatory factor (Ser/Thr protein kinase)